MQLEDDDEVAIGKLIECLYKLDYDDGSSSTADTSHVYAMYLAIKMHSLAQKYKVDSLEEIATEKFSAALGRVAGKISVGEFLALAIEVFEKTVPSHATRTIVKWHVLDNQIEMMRHPAFRTLLVRNPDFAMDLLTHCAKFTEGRACRGRHCACPRDTRVVVDRCLSCQDPEYIIFTGRKEPPAVEWQLTARNPHRDSFVTNPYSSPVWQTPHQRTSPRTVLVDKGATD